MKTSTVVLLLSALIFVSCDTVDADPPAVPECSTDQITLGNNTIIGLTYDLRFDAHEDIYLNAPVVRTRLDSKVELQGYLDATSRAEPETPSPSVARIWFDAAEERLKFKVYAGGHGQVYTLSVEE